MYLRDMILNFDEYKIQVDEYDISFMNLENEVIFECAVSDVRKTIAFIELLSEVNN